MNWTRCSTIGRGSTATVSLAADHHSGELFAAKSAELSLSKPLQEEQSILSKIDSPYIVKYKGFDITEDSNNELYYNLFMEYLPRGTLFEEIQRHGGRLEESMIRTYTWEILQGLEYLHANEIVHCDIKSTNILMGKESAKISDLGCSKYVERGSTDGDSGKLVFSGTPMFMSPEVVLGQDQGFESDIWSLGCTVIEMATGQNPWPEVHDPISALYQIGFSAESPEPPRWLSQEGKDFLSMCLKRDPKERLTARELLKHPFFEDLGLEKERVIKKESPRSVFDQSVWDSFEVLASSQNQLDQELAPSLDSAAERIERLIGSDNETSETSSAYDWTSDEDWITVRSNDDVIFTNEFSSLGVHLEELRSSMFKNVNVISTSSGNRKRGFVTAFGNVDNDIVFRNLKFKEGNENLCSLQYHVFFESHVLILIPILYFCLFFFHSI